MEKSENKQSGTVDEINKTHSLWGFVLVIVGFIFMVWNLIAYAWLVPLNNNSVSVAVDVSDNLSKSIAVINEYDIFVNEKGAKKTCYELIDELRQEFDGNVAEYKTLYSTYVNLYDAYKKNDSLPEDEKASEEELNKQKEELNKQIKKLEESFTKCSASQLKLCTYLYSTPELLKYSKEYIEKDMPENNFVMVKNGIYAKVFKDAGKDFLDYWKTIDEYGREVNGFELSEKSFEYSNYEEVTELDAENLYSSTVSEFAVRFKGIADNIKGYSDKLSENSVNYLTSVNIISITTMVYNIVFCAVLFCYGLFMLVERLKLKKQK